MRMIKSANNMAHRPNVRGRIVANTVIVAIQTLAAVYFVIDGAGDVIGQLSNGFSAEVILECVVAVALAFGVYFGVHNLAVLNIELRSQADALAVARGALADLVTSKFREWHLSPSEAEVALFALKGMQIAEIAELRTSAQGTVRSQLSQIYTKAGVDNQAMLLALFIDDLLDPAVPLYRKPDTDQKL